MIYKYKVGRKWFSFDKSLLQPEDLQIFDKADWTDKLKIITIYKDLKENEDDTINVLSFKKENANKDKRKLEYTNKKEKLMNNIKELNAKEQTKKTIDEIEKLQKELKDLEIEYADIVDINTANTLNVANVNTLNLNNIEKIKTSIQETEQKFNDVKNLLSAEDINKFKLLFENLKSDWSRDAVASSNIEEIKTIIKDIKPSELPEELKEDIENIKQQIEKLIDTSNKHYKNLLNGITTKNLNVLLEMTKDLKENAPRITKEIYDKLNQTFSFNDLKLIEQDLKNGVEVYYVDPDNDTTDSKGKKSHNPTRLTMEYLKERYLPFYSGSNQKTAKVYKVVNGENYTYNNKMYVFLHTLETSKPLFENLLAIYDEYNQKANGFLGLKTNKDARKEQKQMNDKFDEVFKTLRELKTDITEMKKEIDVLKNSRVERIETKPRIINQEIQNVRLRKPQPIQPQPQPQSQPQHTFEDSLKEIMNIRRKDIEPDDYSDESDEWLANGFGEDDGMIEENVGVVPIAGTIQKPTMNKIKLAGSLLEELKEDLKNYGLALNFNVYKKRTRAEQRQQPKVNKASGIAEAKKINDSITKSTDYTDLKELYEDLYE